MILLKSLKVWLELRYNKRPLSFKSVYRATKESHEFERRKSLIDQEQGSDIIIASVRDRLSSRIATKSGDFMFLSIPSDSIDGNTVVFDIYRNNRKVGEGKADVSDLVCSLIEHETIHEIVEDIAGRDASFSLDKTEVEEVCWDLQQKVHPFAMATGKRAPP